MSIFSLKMNIVSGSAWSKQGYHVQRKEYVIRVIVHNVIWRSVPSPMLMPGPGGGSSKSGSNSTPQSNKGFDSEIENIDGHNYVPLSSYRIL